MTRSGQIVRKRILIIEDDLGVIALLRLIFTEAGHEVLVVRTVRVARAVLARPLPLDLVVSGLVFRDADGLDLSHEVSALRPSVPLIVLTTQPQAQAPGDPSSAGATVFLLKPFDADKLEAAVAQLLSHSIHLSGASTRKRLLVVDGPLVAILLEDMFGSDRYEVISSPTRAAAWANLRALPPVHLVFLGVTLPDGDGLELCRQLRAARARVPVIVLARQAGRREEAMAAGADAFMSKPFDIARLRAAVEQLLG
jgi:DNA-binding response OmpR family regulator